MLRLFKFNQPFLLAVLLVSSSTFAESHQICVRLVRLITRVDPWIRGKKIDMPEMSIHDVQLLRSPDGKVPAMTEIYYIVSAGRDSIAIQKRALGDLRHDEHHNESIRVIDGKVVLADFWPSHNTHRGAVDHNPLVTAETYKRYESLVTGKREKARSILSQSISPSVFSAAKLDENNWVAVNPTYVEFGIDAEVTLKDVEGHEFHTRNTMGMWSLNVDLKSGNIYINDSWGDLAGVLKGPSLHSR